MVIIFGQVDTKIVHADINIWQDDIKSSHVDVLIDKWWQRYYYVNINIIYLIKIHVLVSYNSIIYAIYFILYYKNDKIALILHVPV